MIGRISLWALAATVCLAASDPVASRLAKEAEQARNSGQVVRAYLLYGAAAIHDPSETSYAVKRDALAPVAKLFSSFNIESADVAADIKAAESSPEAPAAETPQRPLDSIPEVDMKREMTPQPPPHLRLDNALHSFDLRLEEKAAITQVAQAYGVQTVFDPDFSSKPVGRFAIDQADFRTAMEGITAVTNTFVFPISTRSIFVARDSQLKRDQFEPNLLVTVPLPQVVDPKEMVEAVNAVRGALALRSIGWDSAARAIVIRDRSTRVRVAQSLLEALLLPKAQLSMEVQLIALSSDVNYHYGISLPSSFQVFNFAHIGAFQRVLPSLANITALAAFGGGTNFFGLALSSTSLFAAYARSSSRILYQATVVMGDGQTANLHFGDKYPIPQSTYGGATQSGSGSIYNPIGQVTLEDLGLLLKLVGRVNGDGDISIDAEAQYNSLGTQVYDTIPAIDERQFKGTVRLREGECAIIAGLEEDTHTISRSGIAGLSQIPGLGHVLGENTRDHRTSNTLLVIKPTITRLPMSNMISPQYLLGALRGSRVVL